MTDLSKLFEDIRRLPAGRLKQVRHYAEYVVPGCSLRDRQDESLADFEAAMDALEKGVPRRA